MQIPEECAASLQMLRLDDAIEVSDWERFYRFSISQSFSGPMERKIICQAPAKYQLLERIRQAKKKKRVDALAKAVAEITQGAIKHKVRFDIIKGFSFSALLYDSPYDRTLSDIDTLVNDVDMPKMDALLRSLGFRQFAAVEGGVELELPFPILKANGHHEYFEYEKVIDDVEVVIEVSRIAHSIICLHPLIAADYRLHASKKKPSGKRAGAVRSGNLLRKKPQAHRIGKNG